MSGTVKNLFKNAECLSYDKIKAKPKLQKVSYDTILKSASPSVLKFSLWCRLVFNNEKIFTLDCAGNLRYYLHDL